MYFGNDGLGVSDIITNVGNIMADVRNNGVGVQNATIDLGNDTMCVYCKFSLEAGA